MRSVHNLVTETPFVSGLRFGSMDSVCSLPRHSLSGARLVRWAMDCRSRASAASGFVPSREVSLGTFRDPGAAKGHLPGDAGAAVGHRAIVRSLPSGRAARRPERMIGAGAGWFTNQELPSDSAATLRVGLGPWLQGLIGVGTDHET